MKDLHAFQVLVDQAGRKRLLMDGVEILGVEDVTLHLSADPLSQVIVTLLAEDVTVVAEP